MRQERRSPKSCDENCLTRSARNIRSERRREHDRTSGSRPGNQFRADRRFLRPARIERTHPEHEPARERNRFSRPDRLKLRAVRAGGCVQSRHRRRRRHGEGVGSTTLRGPAASGTDGEERGQCYGNQHKPGKHEVNSFKRERAWLLVQPLAVFPLCNPRAVLNADQRSA